MPGVKINEWYKNLDPNIWKGVAQPQGGSPFASGMGNTGAGPDGIVQPEKPISMMQTKMGPIMLHEGEGTIQRMDGSMSIIPQNKLQEYEKKNGPRGMQTGGTIYPSGYTSQEDYGAKNSQIQQQPITGKVPITPPQEAKNVIPQNYTSQADYAEKNSIYNNASGITQIPFEKVPQIESKTITGLQPQNITTTQVPKQETKTAPIGTQGTTITNAKAVSPAGKVAPTTMAPPPMVTDTTPAPAQGLTPPVEPTAEDQYRQQGMEFLSGVVKGDNKMFDAMVNRAINITGGSGAAMTAALKQEALQAGLSVYEVGALMQLRARDVAGENSKLAGDLAEAGRKMQLESAQIMATQGLAGQQFEYTKKQYTDGMASRITRDVASGASYEVMKRSYPDLTKQEYDGIKKNIEKTGKVDVTNRLSMLWNVGTSLDTIKSDINLRENIAQEINTEVDDPRVDNEIRMRYYDYLETKKFQFAQNISLLMADSSETYGSLDAAKRNDSIVRNVAGFLKLDPTNPENLPAIMEELENRWKAETKSEVQAVYDNVMKSEAVKKYENVPTFEKDMKDMIGDLKASGYITSENTIKEDYVPLWPWDNPTTYRNYRDWEGNYISGDIDVTAPIEFKGNGTKYIGKTGESVTTEDVDNWWKNVGDIQKMKYFKDGVPDLDLIMKEFRNLDNATGVDSIGTNDQREQEFGNDTEMFTTFGEPLKQLGAWQDDALTEEPLSSTRFGYYDADGEWETADITGGTMLDVYYQFSKAFNNGDPMNVEQFKNTYDDGSGYRIDSDGTVLNFTQEWRDKYKDSMDSSYRVKGEELSIKPIAYPGSIDLSKALDSTTTKDWFFGTFKEQPEVSTKYNSTVYEPSTYTNPAEGNLGGTRDSIKFKSEVREWINSNTGKMIEYKGVKYIIYESDPIEYFQEDKKVGGSVWKDNVKASGELLKVYKVGDKTKTPVYLNFGTQISAV